MKIRSNIAISESGFVFHPGTGDSFTLNATGLELIRLLREDKQRDEIVQYFTEKYDVDAHSFEKYFLDFTNALKQFQLMEDGKS